MAISKIKVGTTDHELIASGLTDTSTEKVKLDNTNVAYGTCSTAADTAAKVVTISGNTNWVLKAGSMVSVLFSYTNSAQNPTLNVNSTGAKNIYYGASQITTSNLGYAGTANRMMNFVYDGTQYRFTGWGYDSNTTYTNVKLGHGYATCATAEATTAKVGTLSSYTLTAGGIVSVKFTYAVPARATLNINSKGAIAIYHRGVAITAGVIKAGDLATFMYNGGKYHLLTVDRWQEDLDGSISGLSVSGKTITYTKNDGTTGTITTQDTDTKVTNTLATTTKAYVTGTTSSSTNTGTQVFDTGVYLDTTAGMLTATTFKGSLSGNASTATSATKATQDASGNVITSTYETKSDASAKLTEANNYTDVSVDSLSSQVAYIDAEDNVDVTNPDVSVSDIIIDNILSTTSTNPIANRVVANKFNELSEQIAHYITPEMFGAVGDGTTDDSTAIQTAIDTAGSTCPVYLAKKTYKITSGLVLSHRDSLFICDGFIVYDGTGVAVTVARSKINANIYSISATNGTALQFNAGNHGLNCGTHLISNCNINVAEIIGSVNGLQLYTDNQPMTYNRIKVSYLVASGIGISVKALASYINENWYWIGKITGGCNRGIEIIATTDAETGSNKFFSGSFEGIADNGCCIYLENTNRNLLKAFRCEENFGSTKIKYVGNCISNDIELSIMDLSMVDISELGDIGGYYNILRGQYSYADDKRSGLVAHVNKEFGVSYDLTMNDKSRFEVNATNFPNNVIEQINNCVPNTLHFNNASTNGTTITLGAVYSADGSLALGCPIAMKFHATNGKVKLVDIKGTTILDNTDGSYCGKTVSVRWNGYDYFYGNHIWDVQVLGETCASEEFVKEYAQPKGNYLTSVPSEYITETELSSKGYLTQHQDLSDYAKKTDIPSAPTKTSQLTNDSGFLTGVPTEYVTETELSAKGYLTSIPSEYVTETELSAKGYLTSHQDVSGKADKSSAETWTFTLADGSTVTKKVVLA